MCVGHRNVTALVRPPGADTYPSRPRTFKPTSCLSAIRRAKSATGVDARNGLDNHGFSGLRLRTARERDASRALPQCVATVPLKASRGTTSYYMPVQPEESLRPFGGRAPAHLRNLRAYELVMTTTDAVPSLPVGVAPVLPR
jgi:hypothetical protein